MTVPFTRPGAAGPAAPGRFASRIRRGEPEGCAVALIGLPDDTGVSLNGGRPGAAQGPAAFRAALSRLGSSEPAGFDWPGVFDAGDLVPGASLDETHARATDAAGALLDAGLLPVAVGGGHDLTFPFVRALSRRVSPLAGVYFDAHLDVRDAPGSGMAFRRLVEDCGVSALHLHGFRPYVNAREHHAWFVSHGGRIGDATSPVFPGDAKHLFASFDLDVLDMAHAPGVSAPNPAGWTPREAQSWVTAAGADPRVRCFDLMELSPPHDEGGRTARLAAHLFLAFLQGVARRTARALRPSP
jgi:formiminoglutamase